MDLHHSSGSKLRLSAWEQEKISKTKTDPNIIGYSVVTKRGDELESKGLWEDTAPIMANLLDIADQLGEELGEERGCRILVSESNDFELSSSCMENAHIISLKRKGRSAIGGLANED
jgi:hypothetical protein